MKRQELLLKNKGGLFLNSPRMEPEYRHVSLDVIRLFVHRYIKEKSVVGLQRLTRVWYWQTKQVIEELGGWISIYLAFYPCVFKREALEAVPKANLRENVDSVFLLLVYTNYRVKHMMNTLADLRTVPFATQVFPTPEEREKHGNGIDWKIELPFIQIGPTRIGWVIEDPATGKRLPMDVDVVNEHCGRGVDHLPFEQWRCLSSRVNFMAGAQWIDIRYMVTGYHVAKLSASGALSYNYEDHQDTVRQSSKKLNELSRLIFPLSSLSCSICNVAEATASCSLCGADVCSEECHTKDWEAKGKHFLSCNKNK